VVKPTSPPGGAPTASTRESSQRLLQSQTTPNLSSPAKTRELSSPSPLAHKSAPYAVVNNSLKRLLLQQHPLIIQLLLFWLLRDQVLMTSAHGSSVAHNAPRPSPWGRPTLVLYLQTGSSTPWSTLVQKPVMSWSMVVSL
jgi:hypothetical protein